MQLIINYMVINIISCVCVPVKVMGRDMADRPTAACNHGDCNHGDRLLQSERSSPVEAVFFSGVGGGMGGIGGCAGSMR